MELEPNHRFCPSCEGDLSHLGYLDRLDHIKACSEWTERQRRNIQASSRLIAQEREARLGNY